MRIAPAITLSSEQQAALEQWARRRSLPARVVERGADRAVGRRRSARQANRGRDEDHTQESIALA